MNTIKIKTRLLSVLIAGLTGIFLQARDADPQAHFYQGKTIRIIDGSEPGGTGDLRLKTLMPFLQKHIPGNPLIVVEYMPGGGGRKAANHLYNVKSDGLIIGTPGTGFVPGAVLGETGVAYNVDNSPTSARPTAAPTSSCLQKRKPVGIRWKNYRPRRE
jgi:tripartite-type tricarboxylate transporter receptor subunit TctC